MNEKEIWKEIPGYEGLYEVSNLGRVKSLKNSLIMKKSINNQGYERVNLFKNKKSRAFKVHKLVAITFLNHKPCGYKLVVDHINSDIKDNRLKNLQLITQRENSSKERTLKSGLPVGVSFNKSNKKYQSSIYLEGKIIRLGNFGDPLEASEKYQQALKKYEEEKR
jgi:hypothetical protein